jgi:hypothetical protein
MVGYTNNMLVDLDAGLGVIVLTNGPAELELISQHILKLIQAVQDGNELTEITLDRLEKIGQVEDYVGNYFCGNKSFT